MMVVDFVEEKLQNIPLIWTSKIQKHSDQLCVMYLEAVVLEHLVEQEHQNMEIHVVSGAFEEEGTDVSFLCYHLWNSRGK